jgi:hypothetical protein
MEDAKNLDVIIPQAKGKHMSWPADALGRRCARARMSRMIEPNAVGKAVRSDNARPPRVLGDIRNGLLQQPTVPLLGGRPELGAAGSQEDKESRRALAVTTALIRCSYA